MRSNHFIGTIFGNSIIGQGSLNAVEGTHVVVLRHLVTKLVRRLSLRFVALRRASSWRAWTCTPALAKTPAMAMCPRYTDRRQQRVVVETRGTVGVC
jgi:hypothetical protein